eukprot:g22223.t1
MSGRRRASASSSVSEERSAARFWSDTPRRSEDSGSRKRLRLVSNSRPAPPESEEPKASAPAPPASAPAEPEEPEPKRRVLRLKVSSSSEEGRASPPKVSPPRREPPQQDRPRPSRNIHRALFCEERGVSSAEPGFSKEQPKGQGEGGERESQAIAGSIAERQHSSAQGAQATSILERRDHPNVGLKRFSAARSVWPRLTLKAGSTMGDNLAFTLVGGGCAAICLGLLIFIIVMLASITVVNEKQQILFILPTTKEVKNGPFTEIVWPHLNHEVRDAVQVELSEYAVLKHERTQELRHVPGPQFVFMGAYETLEGKRTKIVMQKQEYVRLIDKMTGEERVVAGPTTLVPNPLEEYPTGVETAIVIGAQNAVLEPCTEWSLITEAGAFIPAPYEEILSEQQARLLEPLEYAVVKDLLTGEARNEVGPKLLQQGPYEEHPPRPIPRSNPEKVRPLDLPVRAEEILATKQKMVLEKDEYLQLLDKKTGTERVLKGPDQVAYERVLEVRTKYLVLTHQAAVTRDVQGECLPGDGVKSNLREISGADGSDAFFLQPYEELVQMQWSVYQPDSVDPVPKETVTMIDLRSQKMFYNVEVRTSDNVKMRIQGTLFWQVKNVLTMIAMTTDPAGDVSQRARSGLIAAVSKATFATFMNEFGNITQQAFAAEATDPFYLSRGETANILQLIIQESTNRINQLQQQESENDVKAAKLVADIELEKQRTSLITTQAANEKLQASLQGQAAGTELVESAVAFIDGLNETISEVTDRTSLYRPGPALAPVRRAESTARDTRSGTLFVAVGGCMLESVPGCKNRFAPLAKRHTWCSPVWRTF